jgi:glycine dehydrogenase
MISDLTGMDISNSSMLDEGTAAAEAMALCQRMSKSKSPRFIVDKDCLPQTIEVLRARAEPVGIKLEIVDPKSFAGEAFGVLLQYSGVSGEICDHRKIVKKVKEQGWLSDHGRRYLEFSHA